MLHTLRKEDAKGRAVMSLLQRVYLTVGNHDIASIQIARASIDLCGLGSLVGLMVCGQITLAMRVGLFLN